MSLAKLGQLKIAGGLVVAIASFGLLAFDANAGTVFTGNWEYMRETYFPGPYQVLYRCVIAIAVFAALVTLTTLGGIVLTLLGIGPPIATLGLFGGAIVLFLGVLIATAIAVDTAKYAESSSSIPLQEARNYNTSEDIRKYVAAYDAYVPPTDCDAVDQGPVEEEPAVIPTPKPEWVCLERTLDDDVSGNWNPFSELLSWKDYMSHEGCYGGLFPGQLMFDFFYSYLPTLEEVPLSEDSTLPKPAHTFDHEEKEMCYGVSTTVASTEAVVKNEDLCELELEAVECAPGWSPSKVASFICGWWRDCVKSVQ
jgi:hypothetical protein